MKVLIRLLQRFRRYLQHGKPGAEAVIRRGPELMPETQVLTMPGMKAGAEMQKNIPFVTRDDFKNADAVTFAAPTRFGNVSAQLKNEINKLGTLWMQRAFAGGIMKNGLISMVVVALGTSWVSASEGQTLREVFKQVNSSVVVVRSIQTDVIARAQSQPVIAAGLGSGVLISPDGEVMTAAHLVDTADKVFVEFSGGEIIGARVIASEPATDVALLKLNGPPPSGATVAKLGDSDKVEAGDQIFVVGAPQGLSYTLTVGYISARRRPNTVYSGLSLAEFFQTDAAINQGNSGGPMFNMAGEIVGIVSAIISKSGGSEGLGFVATSNMARQLLLERRPFWSGLSGYFITKESARVFNVPPPGVGLLVQHVAKDSPAAMIGIQGGTVRATIEGENLVLGGDIILEVQGIPLGIENYQEIRDMVGRLDQGDIVRVKVLRGGEQLELKSLKLP